MYGFATQSLEITQSGRKSSPNIHSPSGLSDMETSLRALQQDLPNAAWVSVAPEWFGDDLRCSDIKISPRISEFDTDAKPKAWSVSGQTTAQSTTNSKTRGTTADFALVQGITRLMQAGQSVLVATKLSLDISPDNANPSPVNPDVFQTTQASALDITCSKARGVIGSPDRTQAIEAEVDHFFGTAAASDFNVTGDTVVYAGAADDFGYRRFILHYAHLCAAAGGVSAFLIGSDLAGLTQLRDDQGRFIAVDALAQLARDVRAILGPQVKLGYAADWREYGAYVPSDAPEDLYFPLDTLWAEPAINFVGMNARIPLAERNDEAACFDVLTQAHIADKYLKKFQRTHPRFGVGSISSTLFHTSAPLAGLTWISEPETLAAFERALGVIARFKSELHHMNTQRRDL